MTKKYELEDFDGYICHAVYFDSEKEARKYFASSYKGKYRLFITDQNHKTITKTVVFK